MLKVLNLYAGIGGNRKLWKNVKVTAVENNPKYAKIYQELFPDDKVIIADAHQFLLEHYKEFDFIWSSPPCPSHSRIRKYTNAGRFKDVYPDMALWQEIIFLKHHFKGKWVVENVKPYYDFIPYQVSGRHSFWSNFTISNKKMPIEIPNTKHREQRIVKAEYFPNVPKQAILNAVNPLLGKHIFECAFAVKQKKLFRCKMERRYSDSKIQKCYELGFDAGKNGANTTNSDFKLFDNPYKIKAWERGNTEGKKLKTPTKKQ